MRRSILISVILAVISAAVFHTVMNAEFVHWDDDLNIINNPNIRHLDGDSLKWMFTDFSFMRRYIPMSWLTWTLTYHFFGLNSHAFHTEGLILHTVNVVLVFWLLQKILQLAIKPTEEKQSTAIAIVSGLGALLWGMHPLRVEVVAWANCQMYAQALLFILVATGCYFRSVEKKDVPPERNPHLWLSVVLFAFSLLTYPVAIGYVAVLLVLDIFLLKRLSPDPRQWRNAENHAALIDKVPYVLVTLAVAGVTLWARSHLTEFWKTMDATTKFDTFSRAAQAFYIWCYYVWKPWFSFTWCPVYTQLVSFSPTALPFVLSMVAVIAATVFFWIMRRRWPLALALWICHLALLVPMLGLTEHPHYPNDRYNYVSALVWSVLIAFVLFRLWQNRAVRIAGITATLAIIGVFSVFSQKQTQLWHDSVTLFSGVIDKLGNNPYRGDTYWRLGRCYAEAGKLDLAIENYSKALKIFPESAEAQNAMAEAYLAQKKPREAMHVYENMLKQNPRQPLVHYNLAVLLDGAGEINQAMEHYRSALTLDPNQAGAHHNLGNDLAKVGNFDEAMQELATAVQLAPSNASARVTLAQLLLQRNDINGAIQQCTEAVHANPNLAEPHYMLGTALAMSGNVPAALEHFQEAVRLSPKIPEGYLAIGKAYSHLSQYDEAVKAYRQGLQVAPNFLPININLGWILASLSDAQFRNGEEALRLATHAVELTEGKNPEAFDLLAAAFAETGKFPEAIKAAQQAISLAEAAGQKDESTQLQARLQLYQSEHALRQ